ncbi:MAG: hypothetical protein KIT46_07795 [Anaerolineales bacterium]|nr:hypothetical protein [Anaerolineales bacterium]MCW5855932.1 hypothetical protein [Anaerolineales bacterium]
MKVWAALWFFAFFVWIPVEDTHIGFVLSLAAAAAGWLALRWHTMTPLRGALLGLAMPLFAVGLMAFKGGLHGHAFPDFTVHQILTILYAAPYTLLAGLVLGWSIRRLS